jgi:arylsulfatase A-like enzyme
MKNMNRRDFLKLSALLSAGTALTALQPSNGSFQDKKPNIIILLADTMSAENLSLYDYRRHTTPNLERLAARALVYHSHYSGGNYTTPGTASTLTGMYPWSHRAINLGGLVRRPLVDQNVFHLLGSEYHRVGFSQNLWADLFLRQFGADIDQHIPSPTFIYGQEKPLVSHLFLKDQIGAYFAIDNFLLSTQPMVNPLAGSASMGYLGLFYGLSNQDLGLADEEHPYGMPSNGYYFFKNRDLYDGIYQTVLDLHRTQSPFFAYFHLMAPHSTYRPTRKFVDSLEAMDFPTKQYHPLGGRTKHRTLLEYRKTYDEYVANVDAEMGRLVDALDQAGVLDDTYFIITSDHGEFFERGELGHDTPLLYDPVIRIPLLVFKPGQAGRQDIHTPTSNTDLVPTLLSIADRPIPDELEGSILPGLGGDEKETERPVFSVEAKEASSFRPLSRASLTMIKGTKKLIHYRGYVKDPDASELYDLQQDAEEENDLYLQEPVTAARMKEELLDRLNQTELPFRSEK